MLAIAVCQTANAFLTYCIASKLTPTGGDTPTLISTTGHPGLSRSEARQQVSRNQVAQAVGSQQLDGGLDIRGEEAVFLVERDFAAQRGAAISSFSEVFRPLRKSRP